VAKLRERISVSKRVRQKYDLQRFHPKKLDDIEVQEKYQVEISDRFAALESLDESFDIGNAWESMSVETRHQQLPVASRLSHHSHTIVKNQSKTLSYTHL
jgi:hypothetical protein